MDIRQLKAFIAVFEERSITAAAQRLFLTQPSLSVTIRQLEETLGVTLFQRLPRGVEVSDQARALYPRARQLVDQAAQLEGLFQQAPLQATLRLGVDADIAGLHLEAVIRLVHAALPGVRLCVEDGCCGDARLAVEESRCEDELFLPLEEEPFVLAVPIQAAIIDPQRENTPWVLCPGDRSHQRLLPFYGENPPGRPVAEAGSLSMAARLVAAGVGAAFLPRSLAHGVAGVRTQEMDGASLTRRVGLCFAGSALTHPAVSALHDALLRRP